MIPKSIFRHCLVISTMISGLAIAAPPTDTLLENHPLQGSVRTTSWTYLASQNPNRISDNPATMTGTLVVGFPGYGASDGLYSYTGPFSLTTTQGTADFDIQHAVFQLDLVWDPATSFPASGGPRLNYNGGSQQLAPQPMIIGRSRELDNDSGIPEMEHLDSFVYRGVTWQWDLSEIEGDIHSISIVMPLANHSSVVGVRIDAASDYAQIGGTTLTPLQIWRDTYFNTTEATGSAADHADPDGDGLVNLIEYALGTRPDNTDDEQGTAAVPTPSMDENRLRLFLKIPSSPPAEITYQVQASSNLTAWKTIARKTGSASWTWEGEGSSQITTETSVERQPTLVGDEVLQPAGTPRFMRLVVSN